MVIAGDGDSCSSGCWDFSPGDRIRDEARFRFHSPVHYSRFYSNRPFALVVDFPRSSFRLCCSSVALALRACIGGSPMIFMFPIFLEDATVSCFVLSKLVSGSITLNLLPVKIMLLDSFCGMMGVLNGVESLIFGLLLRRLNGLWLDIKNLLLSKL